MQLLKLECCDNAPRFAVSWSQTELGSHLQYVSFILGWLVTYEHRGHGQGQTWGYVTSRTDMRLTQCGMGTWRSFSRPEALVCSHRGHKPVYMRPGTDQEAHWEPYWAGSRSAYRKKAIVQLCTGAFLPTEPGQHQAVMLTHSPLWPPSSPCVCQVTVGSEPGNWMGRQENF